MKHDTIDEIISVEGTSFLQFVADNTDHDIATVDGKNTHHGLGSIAIANGKFSDVSFKRNKIPRDKKESWSNITPNDGISIKQYCTPDIPALTKTIFKPVIQVCHTLTLYTIKNVVSKIPPLFVGNTTILLKTFLCRKKLKLVLLIFYGTSDIFSKSHAQVGLAT